MDGRVRTLHPRVHGGLLCRAITVHIADAQAHDIGMIDLICVSLEFEKAVETSRYVQPML